MRTMSCEEVRRALRGRWLTAPTPAGVRGVSIDSRTAGAEDLFVAIRGERFDGHDFLDRAADAGCPAAVVRMDAELPEGVAERFPAGLIGVSDTRTALTDLAGSYRRQSSACVIAVTGSNGKTTVKRMIHHILSGRFTGSCSPKSFNNDIGVPLTLLGAEAGDHYVVCELGTSGPGEIGHLARICKPDVAVITSIAPAHLEGLGDLEGVAREKGSLLGHLSPRSLAVVWGDSPPLQRVVAAHGVRAVWFGESDLCEFRLTGLERNGWGQRFQLNGRLWVELPLPGRHNALNAMAAMAAARRLGVEEEQAAERLADFAPAEMRLERLEIGPVTVINDAYNANPASVLASAEVLAGCEAGRRVMVLGEMGELADQARPLHRQAGHDLASRQVDLLLGVGELGAQAAEAAAEAGTASESFDTVEAAAEALPPLLRCGDVVLLKASRSVGLERLIEPIRRRFESGGEGETRR